MITIFERYTERARQVIVLAQDEARALKHNYIGTEHLLLGLLREEEGVASRVLESLDVTVGEVRRSVARIVGRGEDVTTGQIPFTVRAKRVLELSLREALSLGHNYIGTEHILLGLVRENEGVAARILLDFDADAEKIRNEIIRHLSAGVTQTTQDPGVPKFVQRRTAIELIKATEDVLPYLGLSTDGPVGPATWHMNELSPAQQLREQAAQIDKKDKAIKRFRAAIHQLKDE